MDKKIIIKKIYAILSITKERVYTFFENTQEKLCNFLSIVLKRIYSFLYFVFVIGIAVLILIMLFKDGHYSLEKMFGKYLIRLFLNLLIYGTIFVIAYYIIRKYIFNEKRGFKGNLWIEMTFVIGIIFFLIGSIAILTLRTNISDDGTNIYDLDSVLWVRIDGNPEYHMGRLDCSDQSRQFEVWRLTTCKVVDIQLKSYNATVIQYLTNGSSIPETHENIVKFTAVEDTYNIRFEIEGVTINDEKLSLETTREFKFLNRDQVMDTNNTTVGYFIALVAVILFSLPAAMVNLKELYENNKDNVTSVEKKD